MIGYDELTEAVEAVLVDDDFVPARFFEDAGVDAHAVTRLALEAVRNAPRDTAVHLAAIFVMGVELGLLVPAIKEGRYASR